jgi:hypothetical protein
MDCSGLRGSLVNAVMKLGFHKMLGNYGVAAQLLASRIVISSRELVSRFVCFLL